MATIYDRTLQESTLFELFESEAYSDTVKSLLLAQQEIAAKILSIPGDTWTKRRLAEVKKLIDDTIAAAYANTLPALQIELSAVASVTAANVLLTSFTSVPTATIGEITSDSYLVQGYSAKDLFKSAEDNHARQLKVIVGAGVAQGKPASAIINDLMLKNSSLSKGQLKNAVFTTITEARATTRHGSYVKLEKSGVIKGYQYIATLDGRTTEYCREHDHRKYYKKIEEIQSEINVHFHCRSVFVPITETTRKTDRATTFGPIQDESYSKWFRRQPDSFKLTTLGRKKFDAYKDGDYKVHGLADVTGRNLSLKTVASTLKV